MHISRTPSPPFSLHPEELVSPCAPRLVALTTKYYTPKSRPELQGWREDSELQGSDLRIAAQKPFVVKTKGQWTSQPLYPREKRVVSPGLPRVAHKKSASELLRMPLVPSLSDLYLTEAQTLPTNNQKSTYLPSLRRLDNHSSHHTHSSTGIPNLHLATDPANPLQLKSRPKVPHLMPSTLLKPAPNSSDSVVDRLIRFKSHDRVSVAVEMDGSPYQERVVLERVSLPICRPQRYEKQGKSEYKAEGSEGEEDSCEGCVVTLESEDRNSDFAYSEETFEAEEEMDHIEAIGQLEGGNTGKMAVLKHKRRKIASVSTVDTPALVSPTEGIEEIEEIEYASQEEPPQTPRSDLALPQPTPRGASKPPTPSDIDRAQSPAPTPSQKSATSRRISYSESENSQREEEKEEFEGLSTSSNLQERQKEMALLQTDELMLLKELQTVRNLRQAEAIRRKSVLFEQQSSKETAGKAQFAPVKDLKAAPSITIEISQALPATPPPSPPALVSSLSLSPDTALPLDRRSSIHEYYPEAIEEEVREEQSDGSAASSRKSFATKGVPTPFATSRRTSLAESAEMPVLSRKSTFGGNSKKPRRSLTDTGGLQRAESSFALKNDEDGTNLSSEIPEEEEKLPPKALIEPSKPDFKSQQSAATSKSSSRRNSKVAVPRRTTTKRKTRKPELVVESSALLSAEPSPKPDTAKQDSPLPVPKAVKVTKASGLASAISQSNRLTAAVDLAKAPRRVSFGSVKKQKSGPRRNSDVFTFDAQDLLSADEVFVRQFSFALVRVIIGLDGRVTSEQEKEAVGNVREKVLGVGYSQGGKRVKAMMPSFKSDPSLEPVFAAAVLQAPLFKSRINVTVTPSKSSKSTPKPPFKPKQTLDQSIEDSDFSDRTPHPSGLDHRGSISLFELKHLSLLKNIASNLKNSTVPEPLSEKPQSEPESDPGEGEKPPLPVDAWFAGHAEDLEDDVPASLEALFRNVKPTQMTAFSTNVTNFFKDAETAKTIDVMLATEKLEMDEANYKESVERRKFQEYMRVLPEYWEMRGKDKAELREVDQEKFVPNEQNAYFRQGFTKRKRRNQVISSRQGSEPALLYAKPTFTFTGLSTRYYTACTSPRSVRKERIGDVVLSGGAHLVKEENSYRERIYCRIKQERNLQKFALKGKSRRANHGSISSVKSA